MSLLRFARVHMDKLVKASELWMIKKCRVGEIDGVVISDYTVSRHNPELFLEATQEAMKSLKELDPRRYRRVCRQLDYIVNREIVGAGSYHRKFKACCVDFSKFAHKLPPRPLRRYVSLLIHESTHGVIAQRNIPYDEAHRLRIERLCHLEEYRFARRRYEPGFADNVIGKFNPERWKLSWGPKGLQTAATWKRFRESLQKAWFSK